MSSMGIVFVPESLRVKLGDEALKELIELINSSIKNAKQEVVEIASKGFENKSIETKSELEKLIIETKSDLQKQIIETQKKISEAETKLLKWLFIFWVTQLAGVFGMVKVLIR